MHTQRTILVIVLAALTAVIGGATGVILWMGALGVLLVLVGLAGAVAAYHLVVGPWHRRWGATDDEVVRRLPGDELVAGATASTRAVAIDVPAAEVFPWIVQIGFGRGGWYSYDWIDNDGRPSARRIDPDLEWLAPGDTIAMTPTMGFTVRSIDRHGHTLVSQAPDGTSWAVVVVDRPDGTCRLISRFRPPRPHGFGPRLWMLLADPGAFVMERRMLKGIKARAEAGHAQWT